MTEFNGFAPHEEMVRAFILEGETEDDAHQLARTALLALIRGGFVLGRRDAMPSQPLHLPGENPSDH